MGNYMKKIILFAVALMISVPMLFSQTIDNYVFRRYMERMLQENPKGMLDWFNKVPYSEVSDVPRYEYDFYYAIANTYTYNVEQGGNLRYTEALNAFTKVINASIPNDNNNYKIRSYLFVGGIYNILNEKEIASHIFKFVFDSLSPNNPYYYTSLFWTLYTGYLDVATYNKLYQVFYRANDDIYLYNYESLRIQAKKNMLSKLTKPQRYKQRYYTWTRGLNVAALVSNYTSFDEMEKLAQRKRVTEQQTTSTNTNVTTTTDANTTTTDTTTARQTEEVVTIVPPAPVMVSRSNVAPHVLVMRKYINPQETETLSTSVWYSPL